MSTPTHDDDQDGIGSVPSPIEQNDEEADDAG